MGDIHIYLLLLLLAWSIFNKYFLHKLKNLPPTPLSALAVIGYRCLFKQPIHRTLSRIAAHHGPILLLRFGCRRVLLVSSSSAAEDLFSKNDLVFVHRPRLLVGKYLGYDYTHLVWAPHGGHWRHLRRVSCLEILPFHQHASLADEVKLLLVRLFRNDKEILELKPLFLDLVLNVMTRMFTGKRYYGKKMTAEEDVMEANLLRETVTNSFKIMTGELEVEYFMPILKLLGVSTLEQRFKALKKKTDLLMDGLVGVLRETSDGPGEQEKKVIEHLLMKQKQDPKRYTNDIIGGLALTLMSAGTDTSAGVLEWAFSLLLNHPEVIKKAQNEIDDYVGKDRFLGQSDIDRLPYLNCIIKETMRLYPVAPLMVPHESAKECRVGGYNIPKGTMLMVNVWAIQNDPDIWVEPEKFNPGRFETMVGERDGFKLMPFGYGRRSCPGKHMAVRMIGLALGSLIQCFNWERADEKMIDLTEQTGLALLKAHPLTAACRPRPTMENLLSQISLTSEDNI